MKLGMVGLGKLGTPVALSLSMKGHEVKGYDIDAGKMQKDVFPHHEVGPNGEPSIEPLLKKSNLSFGSLSEVVAHSEVIFVAVQTPHDPMYEGITRLPKERCDFDYTYLSNAVRDISNEIGQLGKDTVVIIISTVLPGTVRREIVPLINQHVKLCYNPFFIAMGTTMTNFINPEFVLFGTLNKEATQKAKQLYRTIHDKPFYETSIENAELIKVAYNTYISMKICFANVLMETSHKVEGCNVDEVTNALALASDRLISPSYMSGGMGDGGGCHPRDNIALSWLAREVNLSYDWFENVMVCRENQTEWLADLVEEHHTRKKYQHNRIGILGKAFKSGTNITTGSPALLLANILKERAFEVQMYDPHIDDYPSPFTWSGVYIVATNHDVFANDEWNYSQGSVVIDPWRYIPNQNGIEIVRVGE